MDRLLSVVVAVYNVEEYLDECLSSIVRQTYTNLEIIIIDDGSTDGSADICKGYASKDERIRYVYQDNAGVALVRKRGTFEASAAYIAYVDGDDCIEEDYFSKLMHIVGNYDLLLCGHKRNRSGVLESIQEIVPEGEYIDGFNMDCVLDIALWDSSRHRQGVSAMVWNKLFKKNIACDVYNQICSMCQLADGVETSSVEGLITCGYDDIEFTYLYLLRAKSLLVTNICGYIYRERKQSLAHGYQRRYLRTISDLYDTLERFFTKCSNSDCLLRQLQCFTNHMINKVPSRMGFVSDGRQIRYIYPFYNMYAGKKLLLYGAGRVGFDYYMQLSKSKMNDIIGWVDKNYSECEDNISGIKPIEYIFESKDIWEYVVIAISSEKVSGEIANYLIDKGIEPQRILWRKPIDAICY